MSEAVTKREFLKILACSSFAALGAGSLSSSALAHSGMPPRSGRIDTDKYGIMILVDGLRTDVLFKLLEENKIPNIKEHLVDRGVTMECVGTLPSTTGPAHLPFLTGTLPGRNDVTGIRWVDRGNKLCRDYCSSIEGVMINKDYDLKVPTLFDILHGEETLAIYEIVNKGSKYQKMVGLKEGWWASKFAWETFDAKAIDLAEEWYNRALLRFTFVWMPGVDHLAHFEGPTSDKVQNAIIKIDKSFAKIINVLDKRGIYDKTMIGLISDHGLRDNSNHLELVDYLSSIGLKTKKELSIGGEWVSIHRYNAVIAVSGNAFAHIYLCDDKGVLGKSTSVHDWPWEPKRQFKQHLFHGWKWEKEVSYESIRNFPISDDKKIDLIEALLNHEGIKFLLTSEKWGRYLIFSSSGQSLIERDSTNYRYSVIRGDDPIGYTDNLETAALMDGKFHSGDDWLKASWNSAYVDALVQTCQLFDSTRCGDIVVLAKPGWDLMDQGHIGSHGCFERDEVLVPAILAGPGISNKRLKYVRTVDIFPTCVKFFGLNPAPLRIDGKPLDIFS